MLGMRCQTSGRALEEAGGEGKTFEEMFQRGRAAAYESGVHLEDPFVAKFSRGRRTSQGEKGDSHPEQVVTVPPCFVGRVELVDEDAVTNGGNDEGSV